MAASVVGSEPAWTAPALRGAVAVVTGASRGVGRGVAIVLAEEYGFTDLDGRRRPHD